MNPADFYCSSTQIACICAQNKQQEENNEVSSSTSIPCHRENPPITVSIQLPQRVQSFPPPLNFFSPFFFPGWWWNSLKLFFPKLHPHNTVILHTSTWRRQNVNKRLRYTPLFTEGYSQLGRILKATATPSTPKSWHVRDRVSRNMFIRSAQKCTNTDPGAVLVSAALISCLRNVCINTQAEKITRSKLYWFDEFLS